MNLKNQSVSNRSGLSRYFSTCCLVLALLLSIQVSIKAGEIEDLNNYLGKQGFREEALTKEQLIDFRVSTGNSRFSEAAIYKLSFSLTKAALLETVNGNGPFIFAFPKEFDITEIDGVNIYWDSYHSYFAFSPIRAEVSKEFLITEYDIIFIDTAWTWELIPDTVDLVVEIKNITNPKMPDSYRIGGAIVREQFVIAGPSLSGPFQITGNPNNSRSEDQKILIDAYILQADSFIKKKYYVAALSLLDFVKNLDLSNKRAFALQQRIKSEREKDIKKYIQSATLAEHKFDYAAALDSYYNVLKLNPFNKAAIDYRRKLFKKLSRNEQLNLAIKSFQHGHKARSRTLFEGIITIEPDNQLALGYLRRLDRSSSQVRAQVNTEPVTLETLQADKVIWPLYLEGLKHMRDKKYSEAIAAWEKVLQTYPDNPNTLNNIDQASLRLKAEKQN